MSARFPWPRVVLAFAAWSTLTILPFLQASALPPKGRWFTGFFHYQDDLYQDLSFVEQARRGQLLFRNKFDIRDQEGFLINLEWGAAGVLARALRLGPVGGFHALGFVAAFGFVVTASRVLFAGGCRSLLWGLALVLGGGGLGWLRFWMGDRAWALPDLATTLFPWNQRLSGGPHALLGSGLFLWALLGLVEWRSGGSRLRWLVPAALLGLIRPFDLGLFCVTAAVLLGIEVARKADPGRHWLRGCFDLAWLAPVLFYDVLAFTLHPSFAVWSSAQNSIASPGAAALAWALAPAAVLAAAGQWGDASGELALRLRRALAVAALCMVGLSAIVSYGFQFLNSLGSVLLLLAALGTHQRWLPVAAGVLAPSSLLLLWQAFNPSPQLFAPRDYQAAVRALERSCRPGDVLVAPIDLSILVAGLTPCHVALGHWVLTPDRETRGRESERFYDPSTSGSWRLEYLRSLRAAFVALPAGRAESLGPEPGFRRILVTPLLELWAAQRGDERDDVQREGQQP